MQITVSEAIRRVHKLKNEIATLRTRVEESVTYMDNDPPAFEYEKSYKALSDTRRELIVLTTAIAESNASARISLSMASETKDGAAEEVQVSVAGALRMLSEIKSELAWIKNLEFRAQKNRETDVVTYEETEEQETIEFLGRITNRPKRVKVVRKNICHMTKVELADHMKQLQDNFDRINTAVESSNHLTKIEV